MPEDIIKRIEIDSGGQLRVTPSSEFPFVYRAAKGVSWDDAAKCLVAPRSTELSYRDSFRLILAAVSDEYGVRLNVLPSTAFIGVPDGLRTEL